MALPFNPTGTLGSNQVTNEILTLIPPLNTATVRYNFIIPRYAPFFLEGLRVTIVPTARSFSGYSLNQAVELTMGKDFFPVLHFKGASLNCGKEVFGAIRFADPDLAGQLTITYMSLGGDWLITDTLKTQITTAQAINPTTTDWETAVGATAQFPVVEFSYNLKEQITLDSVVSSFLGVATLMNAPIDTYSAIGYHEHIGDTTNPHGITAERLGLGNVPNWKLATLAEARNGSSFSSFVTPAQTYQAITFGVVIPAYSKTIFGLTRLNNGFPGGANDGNYAITAAGLLAYKNDPVQNPINTAFEYERQIVYFSPAPIPYPVSCLGVVCRNFRDLLNAVENHLNFKPVQGSATRACIWLPKSMATPVLTCTPI
jgi:hypothetical protein